MLGIHVDVYFPDTGGMIQDGAGSYRRHLLARGARDLGEFLSMDLPNKNLQLPLCQPSRFICSIISSSQTLQ
jgi:hypothetical protein